MFLFFLTSALLLILVLWLFGPRYIIRKTPETIPVIPDDIDDYLQKREKSAAEPIRDGLQASVIWAWPDKRKTEYSLVYLHGFSASRGELSPVFETVARNLGANIFFTRFQGHGSASGEMLKKVGPLDWMNDALEARAIGERIGEKTILIGTSHGGLLANWLATVPGFQNQPAAVILISPNYCPYDKRTKMLTKPWAKQILPLIFGKYRDWDPQNSGHEYYWNTVYPTHAVFPMMAQVSYITPRSPQLLTAPVLVFYSKNDLTVDAGLIETVYAQYPSTNKKLVEIRNSGDKQQHILAGDILSPDTTEEVIQEVESFVQQLKQKDDSTTKPAN